MFDTTKNYWFFLEPYVYVTFAKNRALLYNTLDGMAIFVETPFIINILHEIYKKENGGVVSLSGTNLNGEVLNFIVELRNKFMGNIIDTSLSNQKPVQLIPILNLQREIKRVKADSGLSIGEDIITYLHKIDFQIEKDKMQISTIVNFLNEIQNIPKISFSGDIWDIQIINLLNHYSGTIDISCSYTCIDPQLVSQFPDNLIMKIFIDFPINLQKWGSAWDSISGKGSLKEVIFKVTSEKDCQAAEYMIHQYGIDNYCLDPVYTGENLSFFESHVFLTKEDILAGTLSMREIFTHQALNTYDFGKIIVLANGDVHGNIHHPALGNITTHSIKEIIYKELDEGKSWLNIRNQAPCSDCVYQWLCPSPSNYETVIGRPNLCHVKQ